MAERPAQCPSGDDTALEGTIITHGELDPENAKALDAVAGRVLKQR
jgi:hypothetical protein